MLMLCLENQIGFVKGKIVQGVTKMYIKLQLALLLDLNDTDLDETIPYMESDTEQNETIPYADESKVHENMMKV